MKLLPRTESVALRWVLLILVAGCIIVAGLNLRKAFAGEYLYWVSAFGFWIPLTAGLWLRATLARWVALLFLWTIAILLPLGIINPFAAMDGFRLDPPPVLVLVVKVAPWVVGALYAIHVLDKCKN